MAERGRGGFVLEGLIDMLGQHGSEQRDIGQHVALIIKRPEILCSIICLHMIFCIKFPLPNQGSHCVACWVWSHAGGLVAPVWRGAPGHFATPQVILTAFGLKADQHESPSRHCRVVLACRKPPVRDTCTNRSSGNTGSEPRTMQNWKGKGT